MLLSRRKKREGGGKGRLIWKNGTKVGKATRTTMMMIGGEEEKIVSKRNRRASRQCFGLILSARLPIVPCVSSRSISR